MIGGVHRPRTRPGPFSFDPVAIGRLECDAWAGYYRHEWRRVLTASLGLVRGAFGMSRSRSVAGAWHVLRANQAWSPYPDNDPDAARAHMRAFYQLVDDSGVLRLDPIRASVLEVEWWRLHRARQHSRPDSDHGPDTDPQPDAEELIGALMALTGYVYGLPDEPLRPAAEFRVEAMDLSDAWVAAGCDPADPLLAAERRALVASYTALSEVLARHRPV